jgi:hypothetical protein
MSNKETPMATNESTTNAEQFKLDTTTQEFQVLNIILERYQRMQDLLLECQEDERNRLCTETYNKVSVLMVELDTSLL